MANVAVSDKTHEEIREIAYRMRTDMKTVIEKAWQVAKELESDFEEMF